MPYLCGLLIGLNVAMLAYFMITGIPSTTDNVLQAEQQLTVPIEFENNSAQLPPVIGVK